MYPPGVCCQYEFTWASDKMVILNLMFSSFRKEMGKDEKIYTYFITNAANRTLSVCSMPNEDLEIFKMPCREVLLNQRYTVSHPVEINK
jgi:hypothetical protein